jgi:protein translocase SecG subunit
VTTLYCDVREDGGAAERTVNLGSIGKLRPKKMWHVIAAIWFAFVAIVLMGVILLQRGKGVGLSGAFGGTGGHTAFGAKTGDVMTWATVVGALILLATAVGLNYLFQPPPAPAAPVTPAAPAGGTETPIDLPPPPTKTSTPAGTPVPAEKEVPGGGQAPGHTCKPVDQTSWPAYAQRDIFGVDLS